MIETLPLYEYRCTACGHRYEKIQKVSEASDTVCPACGGPVERPLAAPALQFKGAGWYINDYAPKSASGGASTAASTASDSKPAEAKPAESKPATTESKPATGASQS